MTRFAALALFCCAGAAAATPCDSYAELPRDVRLNGKTLVGVPSSVANGYAGLVVRFDNATLAGAPVTCVQAAPTPLPYSTQSNTDANASNLRVAMTSFALGYPLTMSLAAYEYPSAGDAGTPGPATLLVFELAVRKP